MELRAAVHHDRNNLIVVEDDEEEGQVVEVGSRSPSLVRMLVKGDLTSVEIIEETPERDSQEPSPEV